VEGDGEGADTRSGLPGMAAAAAAAAADEGDEGSRTVPGRIMKKNNKAAVARARAVG